jgi:hypothetical protein
MATEAIKTRTEGRMLFKKTGDARLADAGKMPIDQLEALIAEIKSDKAPKAAKAADPNGAKKKTTATKAVAEAAAPVKAKKKPDALAARERAERDKRAEARAKATGAQPVAKAAKGAVVTPAPKVKETLKAAEKAENERWHKASQKLRAAKAAEVKPAKAAKATPKAEQTKKAAPVQGIARLDNASIDWTRESPVGTEGKRKQVLDLLRKFEGDKSKVFANLESYATEFYPDKDEAAAKKMLTWLIGRVAFDFASKSGQHVSGSRTWTFTPKPAPAAKAKKAAAPASKPASPQKPAQKATAAPKKASKRA